MKIHFCDLCNESVPQGDLDDGKAVLVKGRVVCARCEALLHANEEAAGVAATQDTVAGGQGGAGSGGAPLAGTGVGAMPHGAQPHAQGLRNHRPRGAGGGGTGLALLALMGVAGVGFWLYDRDEKEAQAVRERLGDLRGEVVSLRSSLENGLAGLEERAGRERASSSERLGTIRDEVARGLAAVQEQSRAVETRLAGFDQRLGSMQQSVGEVKRQDAELVGLQQRYSELSAEVADLGRVLSDLADEQEAVLRAAAAPGAAAPTGTPQPAWMGLVAQLSSPEDGDRWQAVIALGETRDPAVAEYLVPVLQDDDIFVRMAAARMLGDLEAATAIPALIDALEDPEPSVREAVYLALKDVTRRDLPFDALSEDAEERAKRVQAWREWWDRERQRLGG